MRADPSGTDLDREHSVDACPVCGRHELALESPPHLPVAGAQPFTELYRMGDLPMPVGVRCRSCGTSWPTIEALRAGDPGLSGEIEPIEGLEMTWVGTAGEETSEPSDSPDRTLSDQSSPTNGSVGRALATVTAVGAVVAGVALWIPGLLVPVMVVVMAVLLVARAVAHR